MLGQDHAIETVVRRLALTRRSFDLRPERPDGVFFFAGLTGVGKTYLAELLSEQLYGPDPLIRLDMSEYTDASAVNRLIGPQPGYVGYDQPKSWLTTKMIKAQSAVVLLDEVEKSHPVVWNTFLQLFDSSRLTDARFGARHVHRIIEEQALQPLVLEPPGAYRAEVNGTTCTWVAADAGGEG